MHMIGHHDRNVELVLLPVTMATTGEHDIARPLRQGPPELGYERDEMWLEIPLQVRQIAAVELHNQILACGIQGG